MMTGRVQEPEARKDIYPRRNESIDVRIHDDNGLSYMLPEG